jgi:hypothetical protein
MPQTPSFDLLDAAYPNRNTDKSSLFALLVKEELKCVFGESNESDLEAWIKAHPLKDPGKKKTNDSTLRELRRISEQLKTNFITRIAAADALDRCLAAAGGKTSYVGVIVRWKINKRFDELLKLIASAESNKDLSNKLKEEAYELINEDQSERRFDAGFNSRKGDGDVKLWLTEMGKTTLTEATSKYLEGKIITDGLKQRSAALVVMAEEWLKRHP